MFKRSWAAMGNDWCRLVHESIQWPAHGRYECRVCGPVRSIRGAAGCELGEAYRTENVVVLRPSGKAAGRSIGTMNIMKRIIQFVFCVSIVPLGSQAQTQPVADGAVPAKASGTSNDRIFYTLPNFLTLENADKAPPLSVGEKFKTTARSSFDPVTFFWHGAQAGISQAHNSESAYGQGAEGYAKRFAQNFADGTIENFTTQAIFPSLLHEDPRYFQSGKGGVKGRIIYALKCIAVTRTDSGQSQINYSEFLGSSTAALISTYSYHPKGDRNLVNATSVWAWEVGYDTLNNLIKEFWPDIRRKLQPSK
jgi:hypothetical protein